MPSRHVLILLGATLSVAPISIASAADAQLIDFSRDVKPILARRCVACHGPADAEAGLNLTDPDSVLQAELASGLRAVVPGHPDESELLRRITSTDEFERMPPEGDPLTEEEIGLIRRWITHGAEWEAHWAFRELTPVEPPTVQEEAWIRTPIDRFVLARLEANGLMPAPEADRRTLIRRAYYGLIGLPPSPEEVEAFVHDADPLAYENLIDRLLDSPQYGEKWARQWLDVVRYAESNSFERDGTKPNAWKYRDYVIKSFNDDKPYDRFIIEQLAGDELPDRTPETITATGYYRLGIWDDEPADELQARYDELDDIVSTTGQAFLGLTLGCARCHDHKVDPIPATDYYGMLAFFHELTPYGTRADQLSNNQTDVSPPELRQRYADLQSQLDALKGPMEEIEQRGIAKMPAPDQRRSEGRGRQQLLDEKLADYLEPDDLQRYLSLKAEKQRLTEEFESLPPRESVLSVAKCLPEPPETFVLLRGSPQAKGEKVEPRFPSLFGEDPPELPSRTPGTHSSGRRLVLAQWIASPDNHLTSRVIVNRIWQGHFGRGIVRSPNNFGQLGIPPTHPELLDWLAQEFVAGGWRMKPLHRLIMTSSTYRMSSQPNEVALAKDPANDLFWRFDMRRLTAEELRDSLLAVNGRLNPQMFGRWFYPTLSQEVLAGQSMPGSGWGKSSEEERNRRSIYIHIKRSLPVPILAVFDFPDADGSCEARFRTTQPAQALTMLNSEFLNEEARRFADRLRREAQTPREQVQRALELALCRPASESEIERGLKLMSTLRSEHGLGEERALELYCLVVLNLNEFVYLD
jgi:cytochrome c553